MPKGVQKRITKRWSQAGVLHLDRQTGMYEYATDCLALMHTKPMEGLREKVGNMVKKTAKMPESSKVGLQLTISVRQLRALHALLKRARGMR